MNARRLQALITILDSGNYIVDIEKGEIFSQRRPKCGVLGSLNKGNGYMLVRLYHRGGNYFYHVHEVIAVAAGLDLLDLTVNHKSGNKLDNRIANLEVMSQHENMKHARNTGLIGKKKRRGKKRNQKEKKQKKGL